MIYDFWDTFYQWQILIWRSGLVEQYNAMLCTIVQCLSSGTGFATALCYRLCLLIWLLWECVHNLVKNYCLGNLDFFMFGGYLSNSYIFVKIYVCVCVYISEFRILFGEGIFCTVHQRRQTKQCTHFSRFSFKIC